MEDALLLNGMFALAARFSNSEFFHGILPKNRGKPFATEALSILQRYILAAIDDSPTVASLQGVVLMGYYWLTRGPNLQAWFLTGIACRMAYFIGLNTIDEDFTGHAATHPDLSPSEWAQREELRRVWWAVLDLDNFGSCLSHRPVNIDRHRMHVLLPVLDKYWFAEQPVTSGFLDPDPLNAWKSLKGSQNRNPHAYYLVANALQMFAHEWSMKGSIRPEFRENVESTIACFAMSLPDEFDLENGNMCFSPDHVNFDNWVICLHLMLQGPRSFLIHIDTYSRAASPAMSPMTRSSSASTSAAASKHKAQTELDPDEEAMLRCRPLLSQVMRAVKAWSPDHVPLAHPFIVCMLLGPYTSFLRCSDKIHDQANEAMVKDLLELTIARFAKYWHVGSLMLGESPLFICSLA